MTTNANTGNDLAFQLIDWNCNFNTNGMKDFGKKVDLNKQGRSYAVVAIMGIQGSGKSTLLNCLFGTKFKVMNALEGRSQTTQGIWLARCPDIETLTIVMDMEGTDGSERGEDTLFENRSALFALAIADVVLINMSYQEIGRNRAANLTLLKTVFQQFIAGFRGKTRKITLMVVVRDSNKSKTPKEKLEAQVKDSIQKIWSSIIKPPGRNDIQHSDFFKVQVKFLTDYESHEDTFKEEVGKLKEEFVNSTAPGGFAADRKDPASGFSTSAEYFWKDIMANKNLDLPSHQVAVATIRCEEIKKEKYETFLKNKGWCKLKRRKDTFFSRDFGKIVNSLLNTCISKYEEETAYFHEGKRKEKKEELKKKLLKSVKPVYLDKIENIRVDRYNRFTEEIDRSSTNVEQKKFARYAERCLKNCLEEFKKDCEAVKIELANWDTSKANAKLDVEMKSYISTKREDRVDIKIRQVHERLLRLKLPNRVRILLCEETDPTWSKVRKHLKSVTMSTISELSSTLSEFSINEEGRKKRVERIENYAKEIVEAKAQEESGRAKEHMITKFLKIFDADHDWENVEEIKSVARDAKYLPMDVLVGLTAIRLEDGVTDNIGHILCSALLGSGDPDLYKLLATYSWAKQLLVLRDLAAIRANIGNNIGHVLSSAVLGSGNKNTLKLLNSSSWSEVPPERTLIKPNECKDLWNKYLIEVENAVNKAIKDFEERRGMWGSCRCCDLLDWVARTLF